MRILHIVGMQNGWAMCNRAANLSRALDELGVRSVVESFHTLTATSASGCHFVHVHGLQLVPRMRGWNAGAVPWGFEVISERSMKHAESCGASLRSAAACFVKNPRLAAAIRPFVSVAPIYVPNGVDTALFSPRRLRVGWVGNQRDEKHLAYKGVPLIRAAVEDLGAQWSKFGLGVEFVMDPGHYPKALLPQAELIPWYQGLDVLVCASLAEGCSNVVNEALACGIPVVSTDAGIARELAEDVGVIVCQRSAAGIATGLRETLGPIVRRRRAMIEKYSWSHVAAQYLECYRRAVR